MNSYYCSIAQKYLHENPPPKEVEIVVKEYPKWPGVVFLVTTDKNMAEIPRARVHEFTDWINATTRYLNNHPLVLGRYAFHLENYETDMPIV